MVQEVLGFCAVKERCRTEMLKGGKEKSHKERCKRLREEFRVGGFMAPKGCGTSLRKACWKTEEHCLRRKVIKSEKTWPCPKGRRSEGNQKGTTEEDTKSGQRDVGVRKGNDSCGLFCHSLPENLLRGK